MRTRLLLLGFLALAGCGSGDPGTSDPRAAKPPTTRVALNQRAAPKRPPLAAARPAATPVAAKLPGPGHAKSSPASPHSAPASTKPDPASENLIRPGRWEGWGVGFQREGGVLVCDNGRDTKVERGASRYVAINQVEPQPIVASVWSKAEGVTGKPNLDYSLYLDIGFVDGSFQFGKMVPFSVGTHDWEHRELRVVPEKPIKALDFYVLFRRHGGKAWFRGPELRVVKPASREETRQELVHQLEKLYGLSKDDRTVAVVDFVDKGPSVELAPLRSELAEMLCGDLAQYEGLRVVERVRVEELLKEADLQRGFVDGAAAQRAGRTLAARYLLTGTFRGGTSGGKDDEKQVSVEAVLFEIGKPQPLARWTLSRPVAGLLDLERDLCTKTLQSVGVAKPVRRAPPAPKPGPSSTVAVLAFRNLGPSHRLDAMQSGFADILQANLAALGTVRLVERQDLYKVLKEQRLSLAGLADPHTALRVGKLLGAERLVYGSFAELGDTLRLDVRLVDTGTTMVLRSEPSAGPTDRFAEQLEATALRLAAGLAVEPPADAAAAVRASTPARKLEAALHLAEAEQALFRAQYDEAAGAYARALVVEPDNPTALVRRASALFYRRDYPPAIEAARQALASGRLAPKSRLKRQCLETLAQACFAARDHHGAVEAVRQLGAEFPGVPGSGMRFLQATCTAHVQSWQVGLALLEADVAAAKNRGDSKALFDALEVVREFCETHDKIVQDTDEWRKKYADPEYRKQAAARSREAAELGFKTFQQMMEGALEHPDWLWWGRGGALKAIYITYCGEDGVYRPLLTREQKEQYLRRALEIYGKDDVVVRVAKDRLARVRGERKPGEHSLDDYLDALAHPWDPRNEHVPSPWDQTHKPFNDSLRNQIWAQARAADLYLHANNDPKEAARRYQRLASEYGLIHSYGAEIVRELHEMGSEVQLPKKAVLVWGGCCRATTAWREILLPKGYAVHMMGAYQVSGAHLAPYELIVLSQPGMCSLTPDEVLALRGYVATGGSLLVVVSPGWEPAAPSILNPLLTLLGARAGDDMVLRAQSTRIAKHPITEGITKAMAKTAVGLEVPEGTALIQAGDRTVLAAFPYRFGRVVVASFGRWMLPDPKVNAWTISQGQGGLTRRAIPPEKMPVEPGAGLQLPLLNRVVDWLVEPHRDGGPLAEQRRPLLEAQALSLKAQCRITDRKAMFRAMDGMVANMPAGEWKEEALWAAGEASMQAYYYPQKSKPPQIGWQPGDEPPLPEPNYYRRLIEAFPQSPLRPYAQWRLADAERHRIIVAEPFGARPWKSAISLLKRVRAERGSYPWAWTQLWIGAMHFRGGDYAEGAACFRQVVEGMPSGPEKAIALLDLGQCLERQGRQDDAVRIYKTALTAPNVYFAHFGIVGPFADWGPFAPPGYYSFGDTNGSAYNRLKAMGAADK